MATKKNTLKKKSFAEIAKLKKSIDIVYESEVLFTLYELSQPKFKEALSKIISKVLEKQENELDTYVSIEQEITPYLIRNMFSSDKFEISDDMTDQEILSTFESFGTEISTQVSNALDELCMKKINQHFETLTQTAKSVDENNG